MVEQMPINNFVVICHLRPNTPFLDIKGVSTFKRFNWDNPISTRLHISEIVLRRRVFAKPILSLQVLNGFNTNYVLLAQQSRLPFVFVDLF